MFSVAEILDAHTMPGQLFRQEAGETLRCLACAHRCLLRPGRRGICQVRFNRNGRLYVPWGYVAALQADPVEKKPFYHLLPGSIALTFGMFGCDMHCSYCQNWFTSQTLRDPATAAAIRYLQPISATEIVQMAQKVGAQLVVSSYNEPFITSEWAEAIFRQAKAAGLRTAIVSNGHGSPEALQALAPVLDAIKIDLKSMREATYRQLGGVLRHVLATITQAHALGLWLEVVTLVVPGLNDSNEELWETARFIAGISPDIPWHVTAFHKDYRMQTPANTPATTLQRAADIGREAGLRYVYAGNLPGQVSEYEHTFCPSCQRPLIRRSGYRILNYRLTSDGRCPDCRTLLAGRWAASPASQSSTGGAAGP